MLFSVPARADRVILSPFGETLAPDGIKADFAISPRAGESNYSWVQFATHEGIEFELNRTDLRTDYKSRFAFNVQYPLLNEFEKIPAISVGIRDILGTGVERRSFYVSASKALLLSAAQRRIFRELKLNFGVGTGTLDGIFVGAQARFGERVYASAEWFRNRPNVGLALSVGRGWQVKASSLDGDLLYGAAYTWTR